MPFNSYKVAYVLVNTHMYVYIYIYIYIHVFMCICIYTYIRISVHIFVSIYKYLYVGGVVCTCLGKVIFCPCRSPPATQMKSSRLKKAKTSLTSAYGIFHHCWCYVIKVMIF